MTENAPTASPAALEADLAAIIRQQGFEIERLRAEVERLKAALLLSQSQNYCTLCGAALEPEKKPKPDLRALLPELAVIRQVMKEPKP